jgi:hypothetical protein
MAVRQHKNHDTQLSAALLISGLLWAVAGELRTLSTQGSAETKLREVSCAGDTNLGVCRDQNRASLHRSLLLAVPDSGASWLC